MTIVLFWCRLLLCVPGPLRRGMIEVSMNNSDYPDKEEYVSRAMYVPTHVLDCARDPIHPWAGCFVMINEGVHLEWLPAVAGALIDSLARVAACTFFACSFFCRRACMHVRAC